MFGKKHVWYPSARAARRNARFKTGLLPARRPLSQKATPYSKQDSCGQKRALPESAHASFWMPEWRIWVQKAFSWAAAGTALRCPFRQNGKAESKAGLLAARRVARVKTEILAVGAPESPSNTIGGQTNRTPVLKHNRTDTRRKTRLLAATPESKHESWRLPFAKTGRPSQSSSPVRPG